MVGYFGDLYNNTVNGGRPVGACGHLIHSFGVQSFGVASCAVIVFGPMKKVLRDRMLVVRAGLMEPSLTGSLRGQAALNESHVGRLLAGV